MKYNIDNYVFDASIFKFFEVRKINKNLSKALDMINTYDDKYDLKNKLNMTFEYSTSPEIVVGMKYDCNINEFDPLYFFSSAKRGYYSFNSFNTFTKKDFYNKVLRQHTGVEYDEFINNK